MFMSQTQLTHSLTRSIFHFATTAMAVTAFVRAPRPLWVSLQRRLSTNTAPTDNMDGGFQCQMKFSAALPHLCNRLSHIRLGYGHLRVHSVARWLHNFVRRTFHWDWKINSLGAFSSALFGGNPSSSKKSSLKYPSAPGFVHVITTSASTLCSSLFDFSIPR